MSLCKQVPRKLKKLVAVFATSTLIMDKKTKEKLELVPSIQYPVTFKD